jgi:hypothetical protein
MEVVAVRQVVGRKSDWGGHCRVAGGFDRRLSSFSGKGCVALRRTCGCWMGMGIVRNAVVLRDSGCRETGRRAK